MQVPKKFVAGLRYVFVYICFSLVQVSVPNCQESPMCISFSCRKHGFVFFIFLEHAVMVISQM